MSLRKDGKFSLTESLDSLYVDKREAAEIKVRELIDGNTVPEFGFATVSLDSNLHCVFDWENMKDGESLPKHPFRFHQATPDDYDNLLCAYCLKPLSECLGDEFYRLLCVECCYD